MNYELAKELKDAGFPMIKALPHSHEFTGVWGGPDTGGTYYQYPTLSELIEACGSNFQSLYSPTAGVGDSGWYAHAFFKKQGYGANPTEAVARLWLAMNRKI